MNKSGHQQSLQLPTGLARPLCWSLRCFPGCRCRKGFVREFEESSVVGSANRPKCIEAKECSKGPENENGTFRAERKDEILQILFSSKGVNETANLNETKIEG
jgi:hypothetical protein